MKQFIVLLLKIFPTVRVNKLTQDFNCSLVQQMSPADVMTTVATIIAQKNHHTYKRPVNRPSPGSKGRRMSLTADITMLRLRARRVHSA